MSNNKITIQKVLSSVDRNSCPTHYNFHCHTTCSDGSLNPVELISQAYNRGIKHISVTDHNTINAYPQMFEWLNIRSNNGLNTPRLWTGIEISCLLKNCLVHILAFDFNLYSKAIKKYTEGYSVVGSSLRAEYVINSIHDAGGIAILAHPARYRLGFKELIEASIELGCDGAEAWYDYDSNPIWSPSVYICNQVDLLLKQRGLLASCGTDTHGLSLSGR